MTPDRAAVGQTIKKLRTSVEMSQEDLAAAIGYTQSTITRMERGDAQLTLDNLAGIADLFGVKVGALIDGEVDALTATAQVQISRAVVCRDCGVIGAGVGADEARKLRAEHIGEHVRGSRRPPPT